MEFFKKRGTAWAFLAIVIVCSFFIGQARQPADEIEILPSGVYVQDNAGVLSSATEDYMTQINNGLVSRVGAEIQVVTIETVGGQDIFDVAIDHGMNTNLSGNSCVFLMAVDDADAVIVQGEDLLYAFSDDELTHILQQNFTVDGFKSRNIDTQARNAFDDLIGMYEYHYSIGIKGSQFITSHTQHSAIDTDAYIGIVIFILFMLLIVMLVSRPRRRRTVISPMNDMGRTYVPPRTGGYSSYGRNNTSTRYSGSRTTTNYGSSRSGGFGSSSRGGSFSSGSRGGSFSSSRPSSSSRSGGFGSSSRGGSFRSGSGSSRGGGFRK